MGLQRDSWKIQEIRRSWRTERMLGWEIQRDLRKIQEIQGDLADTHRIWRRFRRRRYRKIRKIMKTNRESQVDT
jgi:hypothetical protein